MPQTRLRVSWGARESCTDIPDPTKSMGDHHQRGPGRQPQHPSLGKGGVAGMEHPLLGSPLWLTGGGVRSHPAAELHHPLGAGGRKTQTGPFLEPNALSKPCCHSGGPCSSAGVWSPTARQSQPVLTPRTGGSPAKPPALSSLPFCALDTEGFSEGDTAVLNFRGLSNGIVVDRAQIIH